MSATTEAVEANDTSTAKPSIERRDIYTLLCFCQMTNPERGYEPPGRAQIPTNIIIMIIRLIEPSSDSGKDRRPRLGPRVQYQFDPIGDDGGEVDDSQEISTKFVVASCDAPKILEPAETALDDIAPFVGAFAEAVEGHSVGFVWNDGFAPRLTISARKPSPS